MTDVWSRDRDLGRGDSGKLDREGEKVVYEEQI